MLCGASGNKMDNNGEKLWIVHQTSGEGLVELISKGRNSGIIPIGTFLTVEDGENKFFLRVERSVQEEIFKPSVLLVEADLELPSLMTIAEKNTILVKNTSGLKFISA